MLGYSKEQSQGDGSSENPKHLILMDVDLSQSGEQVASLGPSIYSNSWDNIHPSWCNIVIRGQKYFNIALVLQDE